MKIGKLDFAPIIDNKDLVSECIFDLINKNFDGDEKEKILVASINPNYADGKKLCEMYNIDEAMGFNCLIVECKRNEEKKYCALVVPIGYRYNMSSTVRKYTNSRMVSVAPLEYVLDKTKMEYGSITPIGLPDEWEVLIDPMIKDKDVVIIGGGILKSKIMIPVSLLLKLPKVKIIEKLAKEI